MNPSALQIASGKINIAIPSGGLIMRYSRKLINVNLDDIIATVSPIKDAVLRLAMNAVYKSRKRFVCFHVDSEFWPSF